MGSVGDAYDNAMAESFFATLECELLARTPLDTPAQVRGVVFEWIEAWYNTQRMHSSVGYVSPTEFERRHAEHRSADPETGGYAPAPPGRWMDSRPEQKSTSDRDGPESA